MNEIPQSGEVFYKEISRKRPISKFIPTNYRKPNKVLEFGDYMIQ